MINSVFCHYSLLYFTLKKLCINNCDLTYDSVIGLCESRAKTLHELIIGNINKGSFKLICRHFKKLRRSKYKVNCPEPKYPQKCHREISRLYKLEEALIESDDIRYSSLSMLTLRINK